MLKTSEDEIEVVLEELGRILDKFVSADQAKILFSYMIEIDVAIFGKSWKLCNILAVMVYNYCLLHDATIMSDDAAQIIIEMLMAHMGTDDPESVREIEGVIESAHQNQTTIMNFFSNMTSNELET
jgi:hypothetical protein